MLSCVSCKNTVNRICEVGNNVSDHCAVNENANAFLCAELFFDCIDRSNTWGVDEAKNKKRKRLSRRQNAEDPFGNQNFHGGNNHFFGENT